MTNLKVSNEDVRIEEFTMCGFQKQPEYFDEKCFYYISLDFKNTHSENKIPWIKVGNEEVDYDVINALRNNLDSIATKNSKVSDELYYNNASVKLVFLKNSLIAIGNIEETKFLPCTSILQKPISKYQLDKYIQKLYIKSQQDSIDNYFKSIEFFNDYLKYHPNCLECICDEKIKNMQDVIFSISSIIQNRAEKTYNSSSNN